MEEGIQEGIRGWIERDGAEEQSKGRTGKGSGGVGGVRGVPEAVWPASPYPHLPSGQGAPTSLPILPTRLRVPVPVRVQVRVRVALLGAVQALGQ